MYQTPEYWRNEDPEYQVMVTTDRYSNALTAHISPKGEPAPFHGTIKTRSYFIWLLRWKTKYRIARLKRKHKKLRQAQKEAEWWG